MIKYLRKFGYDVTNDIFAENAWYFRNSLVRANYSNANLCIYETTKYLELFLRNLILKEKNELKNRFLHINWNEKVDIEPQKVDIEPQKVDIGSLLLSKNIKNKIIVLYDNLNSKKCFGRNEVIDILHMSSSGASAFLSRLLSLQIIIPVTKMGKGKYIFNITGLNV